MKPEHLEALLLDKSLGELSPAVAELLDDHLARAPQAAQQAAAFGATLQLARRVVAVPVSTPLPPWSSTRPAQAQRRERWRSRGIELLKLAACVALGLLAGRAILPGPDAVRAPMAVVTAAPAGLPASSPRFWSLAGQRRLQAVRPDRREPGYELRWASPLKLPRVEEKP